MTAKLIGQTIGQYQIVEQIGEGGMATVYKAYQPGLDRYVAFKVLPEYYLHDSTFLTRFEREARVIAKLSHPHILPIYDYGRSGQTTFIVMQYIEGGTLKEVMGRPLALSQAALFVGQIADALDYAHRRGILHRDVKPGNILLEEGRRVLLTDFGLAKMAAGSTQLTEAGVGIGTPAYMSPEQGQGLAVDARTDIYALGIILYEMATGRVPFEAATPMGTMVKHITEPLPSPRALNPNLPPAVEQVIFKALAKDKEKRYASAGQLAAALNQALAALHAEIGPTAPASQTMPPLAPRVTEPVPPAPSTKPPAPMARPARAAPAWPSPAPPPAGRPGPASPTASPRAAGMWPWLLAGGLLVALILLTGLAGYFFFVRPPTNTPTPGLVKTLPTPTFTVRPTSTLTPSPATPGAPWFGDITFAQGYDPATLAPIKPGDSFSQGLTEIHAIFEYKDMANGQAWERVWYRDNQVMSRSPEQWRGDEAGVFDYFINAKGQPLQAGRWRLELYVEGKLLSAGSFTIEQE
ncbi:MAG: serine/threonine protein kinase [Anaerolineae bacterium]|nr:serine/threonine protein kinase [Anaerolineae bacterium]